MIRVLFVDDEKAALEGLRVRLRTMRDKWHMAFAESGASALTMMSEQTFDVIVTDMRMPDMDGARLLRTVSTQWPHAVRIVLSGSAEVNETVRLVPVAHQYLSKPCDLTLLEKIIDRCRALQLILQNPALRSLVGQLRQLPPIPEMYAKLQTAIASESASVHEIAHIVAQDTVIAAKLLQMVNSAFFRVTRRIEHVEQAVSYLGLITVRNLVAVAEVFGRQPPAGSKRSVDLEALQAHSLSVAAAAHALAGDLPFANDALLAGMLHDIGYWVLAQERFEDLEVAVQLAQAEQIPLHEAERRVLGASHAEIGAYLMGLWGLSTPIVEAIAYHHRPRAVSQSGFDALAALSIAHALVQPHELQAFSDRALVRTEIDADYLCEINAPFDWHGAQQRIATKARSGIP